MTEAKYNVRKEKKKKELTSSQKKLLALLKTINKEQPKTDKEQLKIIQRVYRRDSSCEAIKELLKPAMLSAYGLVSKNGEPISIWYDRGAPEVFFRIWEAMEKSKRLKRPKSQILVKSRIKKRILPVKKGS